MQSGGARQTFAVPVTNGNYAPETIDITDGSAASGIFEVSVLLESIPASAAIELWLLRRDGATGTPGDWVFAKSWTAVGLQDIVMVSQWRGAEIRARSGGSSGNAVVSATWA
jgi:hypothetical protein